MHWDSSCDLTSLTVPLYCLSAINASLIWLFWSRLMGLASTSALTFSKLSPAFMRSQNGNVSAVALAQSLSVSALTWLIEKSPEVWEKRFGTSSLGQGRS